MDDIATELKNIDILIRDGKYEKAYSCLWKALENYPEKTIRFVRDMELNDDVTRSWSVELDKEAWSEWENVVLRLWMDRSDEACEYLKKAINAGLRNTSYYRMLGAMYADADDYADAFEFYQRAIECDKRSASLWLSEAIQYYEMCRKGGIDESVSQENEVVFRGSYAIDAGSTSQLEFIGKLQEWFTRLTRQIEEKIEGIGSGLSIIKKNYIVEDLDAVGMFLDSRQHLLEVLDAVSEKLVQLFGGSTHLYLDFDQDPEEEDDGLFIEIASEFDPDQVLTKILWFYETYWNNIDFESRRLIGLGIRGE